MKQSKTFLLLGVIVAVLILGIAYAAITDVTLSVAGNVTASPDQANFKVGFIGTYALSGLTLSNDTDTYFLDGNGGIIGTSVPAGSYAENLLINVEGLNGAGDKGTITLTISNGSTDISATLAASAYVFDSHDVGAATYFEITPTLGTATLAAGGSTTLVLEIECIKTPIAGDVTAGISASVTATPNN